MLIGEICNRDVVNIPMNDSIIHAAFLMREFHVGDLVVTYKIEHMTIPVGILTDRDIVIEVLAKEIDPKSLMVKDIMSTDLSMADEDDTVLEVLDKMVDIGVRRMPIVNRDQELIGIVSIEDLIEEMSEHLSRISKVFYKGQQYESILRD